MKPDASRRRGNRADAILAVAGTLDPARRLGPVRAAVSFSKTTTPRSTTTPASTPTPPAATAAASTASSCAASPTRSWTRLDCPDANLLTPKRNTTLTALQALSLLNDSFVIRQCEHLAAKLAKDYPNEPRCPNRPALRTRAGSSAYGERERHPARSIQETRDGEILPGSIQLDGIRLRGLTWRPVDLGSVCDTG